MRLCGDSGSLRGMREFCVALPLDVRKALLGESGLSASAAAAIECPFDAALTAAIASELVAKCRKRGLASAADILDIALSTLSGNGHASGRPRAYDERLPSTGEVATSDCAPSTSSEVKFRKRRRVSGV